MKNTYCQDAAYFSLNHQEKARECFGTAYIGTLVPCTVVSALSCFVHHNQATQTQWIVSAPYSKAGGPVNEHTKITLLDSIEQQPQGSLK